MGSLSNNSVETVNAAATAIVNAESRVQPTSVQVILLIFYVFICVFWLIAYVNGGFLCYM